MGPFLLYGGINHGEKPTMKIAAFRFNLSPLSVWGPSFQPIETVDVKVTCDLFLFTSLCDWDLVWIRWS